MSRLLFVAVVALGCGNPPPASEPATAVTAPVIPADAAVPADAASLDRDLPRLAERSVKLYEDIVAAFAAAGEDCVVAAAKLAELQQANADVTAANLTVLREGRAKDLKVALQPYDDRFEAAARTIMSSPTLSKCSQDAAFARAFDELVGTPP